MPEFWTKVSQLDVPVYLTPRELLPSQRRSNNADEEMNKALRSCRASFFRNAYRFLNNEADAEDAVQDALLSAYKHIDQFRGEAQMSTWLTAIVSNAARMQLRQRQIHVSLDEPISEQQEHTPSDSLTDGRPSPEDDYRESELYARVKGFVTRLSPPLRKTFELRALDGLTINEAARILGVPNGTVKARLARARAKLRRLMGREAGPQRRALQTYVIPSMSGR